MHAAASRIPLLILRARFKICTVQQEALSYARLLYIMRNLKEAHFGGSQAGQRRSRTSHHRKVLQNGGV